MEYIKISIMLLGVLMLSGCKTNITIDEPLPTSEQTYFYVPLYQYLDTNGDGTGSLEATGNYLNSTKFYIAPANGEVYVLSRLMTHLKDTGSLDADSYGNGITLTNGIIIYVKLNGTQYNLTDRQNIFTNADFGGIMFDADPLTFGIGDESLNTRFTMARAGQPLILNGDNGDEFGLIFQDDFTNLNAHRFQVQGFIKSEVIY